MAETDGTLHLGNLQPRIRTMVERVVSHTDVLLAYDCGQLILNYRGDNVTAQLDKLALDYNTVVPLDNKGLP